MSDQRVVCVVLPDKKHLNIAVGLKSIGQEVIGRLSELLGIKELQLFGLSLEMETGSDTVCLFLDLQKRLCTYFPKSWKHNTLQERIVLRLKIQYYVVNGRQIMGEKARRLYYADLKGRVLNSQCHWQEGLYFQLTAYALQADLGDWKEGEGPYFHPHDYFPPWILTKRGSNYVEQHTPALHRELLGVCESDAVLLFIQEACRLSDVPCTFYSLSKGKKKQQGASVLVGLTLTGLQVYEMVNGEQQLLHELVWSSIDRITFQARRFEIRADVLPEFKLGLYTLSARHSQHLMKHISDIHRLHLKTRLSSKKQQRQLKVGGGQYRELCVRDKNDAETDESEDELPPLKSLLDRARKLQAKPKEPTANTPDNQLWDISKKGIGSSSGSSESCRYKMAMLKDVKAMSCFNKLRGESCAVNQTSIYCNIEINKEVTCIKWLDANIRCLTTETGSDIPIENSSRCAEDQESLSCTKEFPHTDPAPKNGVHSTTFWSGVVLAVLLLIWLTF